MGAFLILPVLITGYIFCSQNKFIWLKVDKLEGQKFYVSIASIGFCLFMLSSVLVNILWNVVSWLTLKFPCVQTGVLWLQENIFNFSFLGLSPVMAGTIFLCMPLSFLTSKLYLYYIYNIKYSFKDKSTEDKQKKYNDYYTLAIYQSYKDKISKALADAVMQRKLYLISMKDRKVYIGFIDSIYDDDQKTGIDHFEIIPIMSGFRDKDNLSVEITTHYEKVTNNNNGSNVESDDDNSRVVTKTLFNTNDIVSMTEFDKKTFDDFMQKK